jgi:hypothetical protein
MPSFQTIYRAIVMLAVGVIVVKGWQLYGPSADQVKSAAMSAMDMAETAWKNWQKPGEASRPATDAQESAPPFAKATQQPAATASLAPSAPLLSQAPSSVVPANAVPAASIPASQPTIVPPTEQVSQASTATDDRMPALLSRLEQLGATDPKVAPWGSSGHLYRCSCGAALANSPAFTQHFESVATEPALAVEQVVAKVETWRTARRDDAALR